MTDRIFVVCAALLVIPALVLALSVVWLTARMIAWTAPLWRWRRNEGDGAARVAIV